MNRAVRRFSCFVSHPVCPIPTRYALAPLVLTNWRGAPLFKPLIFGLQYRACSLNLLLSSLLCRSNCFGGHRIGQWSFATHAGEELFVLVYNAVPGVMSLNALLS